MSVSSLFPNAQLRVSYGSTETTGPLGALLSTDVLLEHPGLCRTCGKLYSLCELKLVGEDGCEVEQGEVGEAWVRSPMVFGGYIKQDGLTEQVFEGGWYKTSDLMRQDENGYFYLMGRSVDMIKTGGENVYAQEVEQVVREYSPVLECAAIGVPDACFGEAVAIVVQLKEGSHFDRIDFVEFCRANMASYRKPRYIAFVNSLPHGVTGKLNKQNLRSNSSLVFEPLFS